LQSRRVLIVLSTVFFFYRLIDRPVVSSTDCFISAGFMASSTGSRKLLVIGFDAADWKMIHPLVDAGLMPTLSKFIDEGCIGNLATLHPSLSPMLWTSIATGKTADKHGVCGFVEPLADASGVRLVGSATRTTKAFWNITSQAGLKTHVIGWYASHPAEPINGVCVSDQFIDAAAI